MRSTAYRALAVSTTLGLAANALAGDFRLGVNEALVSPRRVLEGDADGGRARLEGRAQLAEALGAQIVRVQSSTWPWLPQALDAGDWSRVDQALDLAARHHLAAIVVVAPWPANEPWKVVDSCALRDEADWTRKVTALVERYDGDGVDDGPGAGGVVAWEVDNEPDLHEYLRPGFCPPETYARTFDVTAAAIHAADPRAAVLTGGIYRPQTDTGLKYMQAVGPRPGQDGVALHLYPGDEGKSAVDRAFEHARAVFGDRPIWVTETSTTGHGDGDGRADEAEQARGLVDLVAAMRADGAVAVLWHTLVDPPVGKKGGVPHPGLYAATEDGGALRPAGLAFQRLVGLSETISASGDLRWVDVPGGELVWPVDRSGKGDLPFPIAGYAGGKVHGAKLTGVAVGAVSGGPSTLPPTPGS